MDDPLPLRKVGDLMNNIRAISFHVHRLGSELQYDTDLSVETTSNGLAEDRIISRQMRNKIQSLLVLTVDISRNIALDQKTIDEAGKVAAKIRDWLAVTNVAEELIVQPRMFVARRNDQAHPCHRSDRRRTLKLAHVSSGNR